MHESLEGASKSGSMPETFSVGDLSLGTPVIGSDHQKIGVVNQVVNDPSAPPGSRGSFYFEVDRGGFLGIGSTHLYIPAEDVSSVDQNGDVRLTCTAEEAAQKYARRPEA